MVDRVLGRLAVVLLVTIAGCGGTPVADAPADRQATATTTPEPPREFEEALSHHRDALREAGSFTVVRNGTTRISVDDRSTVVRSRLTRRFDLSSGRALAVLNATTRREDAPSIAGPDDSWRHYRTTEGEVYTKREEFGMEARYSAGTGDDVLFNETSALAPTMLGNASFLELEYEGRGSVAGEEGYVYAARGVEAAPELLEPENGSLDAFAVEVLTTSTGRIAVVDVSFEMRQGEGTWAASEVTRYSAVGSTTVEPPAWLDEARSSTDGTEPSPTTSASPG